MEHAAAGTVRIGYVRALLDYLENHQIGTASVFAPELQKHLTDNSYNERIPVTQWSNLMAKSITTTADEFLPLKLAREIFPKHWGVFAYATMTCKNVAEAAALLVRYESLIDDANETRMIQIDDRIGLQWIPKVRDLHPALMQMSVASWVISARRYTGRNDLQADADFTFAAPSSAQPYIDLFGGTIRFAQEVTQLTFPQHYLELPITLHDPDSHQILVSQVIQQLENLQRPDAFQTTIKNLIVQQLCSGRCTLENIASEMNLPPRTLQYQLEQNGSSFRTLLDNTRAELARHYLSDFELSLVDVAFLLGFSEQSPFTKAFKRWTGETPGEYRKRQGH